MVSMVNDLPSADENPNAQNVLLHFFFFFQQPLLSFSSLSFLILVSYPTAVPRLVTIGVSLSIYPPQTLRSVISF